jgi:hypothetical protein
MDGAGAAGPFADRSELIAPFDDCLPERRYVTGHLHDNENAHYDLLETVGCAVAGISPRGAGRITEYAREFSAQLANSDDLVRLAFAIARRFG